MQDKEITCVLPANACCTVFAGVRFYISHTAKNRNCAVSLVRDNNVEFRLELNAEILLIYNIQHSVPILALYFG